MPKILFVDGHYLANLAIIDKIHSPDFLHVAYPVHYAKFPNENNFP